MWIIKWVLLVIAIVFLIGFAMQNADVSVPIRFLKWETVNDLPLWLVMYISFVAGMVFWLAVSIYQVILLKSENRKCQRKIKNLENELNKLRNVSVEDTALPEAPAPEEPQQTT